MCAWNAMVSNGKNGRAPNNKLSDFYHHHHSLSLTLRRRIFHDKVKINVGKLAVADFKRLCHIISRRSVVVCIFHWFVTATVVRHDDSSSAPPPYKSTVARRYLFFLALILCSCNTTLFLSWCCYS